MDRDVFARRCAAIRAASPTAEIRQVLLAANIGRERNELARRIARRGYSPGYLAGWIYQRAHLPTPELVGAIRAIQNLERSPRFSLPVGADNPLRRDQLDRMLARLGSRMHVDECPYHADPDMNLDLRRRAAIASLTLWGVA